MDFLFIYFVCLDVIFFGSSFIPVPWLNLMANLQERAGSVVVRLGGNTQEYAKMVDSLPDGNTFLKDMTDLQGTVRFSDQFFIFIFTVSY